MPAPVITALPAAPSRADPANFAARGDALLGALPAFVAQTNALAVDLTAKAALADAQGTNATNAASVASNAKDLALSYRDSAYDYKQTASGAAATASQKAAEAAASAASAAAVSGIPAIAGKQLYSLRVNAAGTALEWVLSGDALGFTPVQQNGGTGHGANKIYVGWAASGGGLKVQVDATDQGFIPFSSTSPTGTNLTFTGKSLYAFSFVGQHYGDGSNITGLTAAQLNTAYGYVPQSSAVFAPGAVLEVGGYLDFHAASGANDWDVRLRATAPTGGTGTSILEMVGVGFRTTGWVDAAYYTGNMQYLTGMQSAQVTAALGYTPVDRSNATLYGATSDIGSAAPAFPTVQGAGGSGSAGVSFLRPTAYGINMGLAADNSFALGGYSMGANVLRFASDTAGNFTALGNVTSTSDIRFKTELARLQHVSKRLLAIEHGGMRYLDTRTGEHKYGVSAQGVQKHFPDAVVADERGHLSVAYGQLALAALIEVTREFAGKIAALENELQTLKAGK